MVLEFKSEKLLNRTKTPTFNLPPSTPQLKGHSFLQSWNGILGKCKKSPTDADEDAAASGKA